MSKSLGQIKKDLSSDDISMLRTISRHFAHIAQHNPEAVIAAFDANKGYISKLDPEKKAGMVTFYGDFAKSMIDRLDRE